MKELDPFVLMMVFQEMLGLLFWPLLLLVILVALTFVGLLVRERSASAHRLVRSQAWGLPGGVAALVLMVKVSSSGFMDAGGPIDWLLIALVFMLGLIGATIVFYTIAGWRFVCRKN